MPSLASILRWPEPTRPSFLLDPCAGDGTAIRTLRERWIESAPKGSDFERYYSRMAVVACELEGKRAAALAKGLPLRGDLAFHGDAFRLCPSTPTAAQATVLFLNPPYDVDPVHERLEHRFLLRFAEHLHAGSGVLFYLVPHYALAPSADFLARNFLEIRAWRLPEPEFSAYRQVRPCRKARPPASRASLLRSAHQALGSGCPVAPGAPS